jgi:hypothetical protein
VTGRRADAVKPTTRDEEESTTGHLDDLLTDPD